VRENKSNKAGVCWREKCLLLAFQLGVPRADAPTEVRLVDGGQLLVVQKSLPCNPHIGDAEKEKII